MLLKEALPCFFGQQVINESEKILEYVYDLPWYETSAEHRRNLIILMERCQNEITFTVQGFYTFDFIHLSEVSQLALFIYLFFSPQYVFIFFF